MAYVPMSVAVFVILQEAQAIAMTAGTEANARNALAAIDFFQKQIASALLNAVVKLFSPSTSQALKIVTAAKFLNDEIGKLTVSEKQNFTRIFSALPPPPVTATRVWSVDVAGFTGTVSLPASGGSGSFSVPLPGGSATFTVATTVTTMTIGVTAVISEDGASCSGTAGGSGPIVEGTTALTASGAIAGSGVCITGDGPESGTETAGFTATAPK